MYNEIGDKMNLEENNDQISLLAIIRLINKNVFFILGIDNKNQEIYQKKLRDILNKFKDEQYTFTKLAKNLSDNAPFKGYQRLAMSVYIKDLQALLEELKGKGKQIDSFFSRALTKINLYTKMLEQYDFDIIEFEKLTNALADICCYLNAPSIQLIEEEISYLFIETLKKIRIHHIDLLIHATNSIFYPKIIALGEEYVCHIILNQEDPLYIEILNQKEKNDVSAYLKFLFETAYDLKLLHHEAIFIPFR